MSSQKNSLRQYHTFALSVTADSLIFADSPEVLINAWRSTNEQDKPFLLLGEGSNVLFLGDFLGTVVFNRIKGIVIEENDSVWRLHVGAGENWHNLVATMLGKGICGLENLALIPGCVGSAPIQNIGAYGIEFKSVCEYVELLDLTTQKVKRLSADECEFGYRDSIFKHQYRDGYAIIAVGLTLPKQWQPVLDYGDLKSLDLDKVTAKQIFDVVCQMRRTKLPDPALMGNAGSFFKNPIVNMVIAERLLSHYPDMPVYQQADGSVKLAAGWLIDSCRLKGKQIGEAAVHDHQALVIVNKGDATPQDLIDLAYYVRQKVAERFDVWLEPEVRFIDAYGEVDAVETLS